MAVRAWISPALEHALAVVGLGCQPGLVVEAEHPVQALPGSNPFRALPEVGREVRRDAMASAVSEHEDRSTRLFGTVKDRGNLHDLVHVQRGEKPQRLIAKLAGLFRRQGPWVVFRHASASRLSTRMSCVPWGSISNFISRRSPRAA